MSYANPADYYQGVIDVPTNNWFFTHQQLEFESPSRRVANVKQRISFTAECQKRARGIAYMYVCCRLLRLSRCVALTASLYFHRFYMRRDFTNYPYIEIAATSLFLACKAEECRRKLSDVVKVCASVALKGRMTDEISEDSKIYWKWKDVIINLEELMLEVLCFDVTPENPYRICMKALDLKDNNSESGQKLFGQCTNFFELLSRLPLALIFDVNVVCALGLTLACASTKMKMPATASQLGVNKEEVWKCYCEAVELAKQLGDDQAAILNRIPKVSKEAIVV